VRGIDIDSEAIHRLDGRDLRETFRMMGSGTDTSIGTYSSPAMPVGYLDVRVRTSCESGSRVGSGGSSWLSSSSGIDSLGDFGDGRIGIGRENEDGDDDDDASLMVDGDDGIDQVDAELGEGGDIAVEGRGEVGIVDGKKSVEVLGVEMRSSSVGFESSTFSCVGKSHFHGDCRAGSLMLAAKGALASGRPIKQGKATASYLTCVVSV
jgi:hypothetical protein